MNILFTTSAAPEKSPFFTTEKRPPLGLGFLMSIVREKGHKVFFIDNYLKPSNFIEEGYLQKNNIDFVAIYANTICYRDTLRMFNEIEELRKNGIWEGKIIVGGPHTSVALDSVPEFVDYIVQGEGENAVLEIIEGKANVRVIRKERMKDLNPLPFPPWDIFGKLPYDYFCPWMDIKPVFTMNTSRGCPFNCAFCSVDSIWGRHYACFSADRIISEIEYLIKDFGAKGIYFREDNFNLDLKRTEEFCEKLKKKDINISWACELRVDNVSEQLVKSMSAAGCKAVYLGVESGSQRILDMLNKKITVGQIENSINWFKKYGVKTYCSLIAGTPGETFEDYLLTKKMLDRVKPSAYGFNIFVGIPDSFLYRHVLDNKLYEYIDDLGLVYLPGYDIKAKFFYDMDSRDLVDFEFKQRTDFDRKLLRGQYKQKLKRILSIAGNKMGRYVPCAVKDVLKRAMKKC
ncbi:MAG: B12-binding domain-containing radical SAM protein [Candidatus Omnitrophica bacterium]|nr:B12-binding domain-containing radical SAM protein [Candidatus Omnitrophota bacterium]